MSELRNELEDAIGKKWVKRLAIVATVIFVYLCTSFFLSIWPFSSAAQIIQKVTSANAIIGNYEYFYDMKGQIDATKAKLKVAQKANLPEASGIEMVLQGMIAEYNAKSRMITRNLWKAGDLPYQIEFKGGTE